MHFTQNAALQVLSFLIICLVVYLFVVLPVTALLNKYYVSPLFYNACELRWRGTSDRYGAGI